MLDSHGSGYSVSMTCCTVLGLGWCIFSSGSPLSIISRILLIKGRRWKKCTNPNQEQCNMFLRCWMTYFKGMLHQSQSLQDRIQELLEAIEPYVFVQTPMCKALEDAETVFERTNATQKVLFVLSDGVSTDNNPCPIAQRLRDLGVTIATCFLAPDHIMLDNPRHLFYQPDPSWKPEDGRIEMSSTLQNTHTPNILSRWCKLETFHIWWKSFVFSKQKFGRG